MLEKPIEPTHTVSAAADPGIAAPAARDVRTEIRRAPKARSIARAAGRGAAAGLFATALMSATMLASQRVGLLGRMPPRKISDSVLGALGLRRAASEPAKRAFATVNHFAFGAACGALFEVGRHLAARGRPASTLAAKGATTAAGVLFGTMVWTVSYMGWVPALGIMPPPERDRPGRPTSMVVAHWVFGGALGALLARSR